jgi:hypothetical protein
MKLKEKVSFLDNILKIGSLQVIVENKIKEIIVNDDLIFVLCEYDKNGKEFVRNIMAYDFNGQLRWQEEDIGEPVREKWFFVGINLNSSGNPVGYNWVDREFELDRLTGKILNEERTM